MNSHIEQLNIKHEYDPLAVSEIKIEPLDIKIETVAQTEEHNISPPVTHAVASFKTESEVEQIQESFVNWMDYENRSQYKQKNKEDNGINVHDSCKSHGTNLQKEKYSVDVFDNVEKEATTCVSNNSFVLNEILQINIEEDKVHSNLESYGKDLQDRKKLHHEREKTNAYSVPSNSFVGNNTICTQTLDSNFKCNICNKYFSDQSKFTTHNMYVHRKFTCKFCGKLLTSKFYLSQHVRTHTNEKPYTCNICSKTFSRKFYIFQHIRTHTNEKPYTCNICNKSFPQQTALLKHSRTHTNEKPFSCNICNRSYSTKSVLVQHLNTHTSDKPFSCKICNKQFTWKSVLARHKRTHLNEKPFSCNFCSKSFSLKGQLDEHTRIHTNEKPFTCNVCAKSFSRKCSLTKHALVHNERLFRCNKCTRSFVKESTLVQHKCTPITNSFPCNICNKLFYQKNHLAGHLRIHTNQKPLLCNMSIKSFTSKSSFDQHL